MDLEEPGVFVNHSCNPNAGLRETTLLALKDIYRDEEITYDYSTTMNEDFWTMRCDCRSPRCRGEVKDFKYLPEHVQERYLALGIVPEWLRERMGV